MKRISLRNGNIEVAGNVHLPPGFDGSLSYPAIVLATPGSSMKEQIGAIYAEKLAQRGFVALAFDPSHQGESGGEPRGLEDPASRIEDLRCAVDYLTTLAYVDADRIGLLGICAGGDYAISAALTERRFRAVGTVVANDIGEALRRLLPDYRQTLADVANQRTAEARGGEPRRDPWIPDSLEEAENAGIPFLFVAVGQTAGAPVFGMVLDASGSITALGAFSIVMAIGASFTAAKKAPFSGRPSL